jgi:hypothetical protein
MKENGKNNTGTDIKCGLECERFVKSIAREQAAFQRKLPSLLPSLRGKYVALVGEEIVDQDCDEMALVLRMTKKSLDELVVICQVTDEAPLAIVQESLEEIL